MWLCCSWRTPAVLRWIRDDDGFNCYLWRISLCVHTLPCSCHCAYPTQQTLKNIKWHHTCESAESQLPLSRCMLRCLRQTQTGHMFRDMRQRVSWDKRTCRVLARFFPPFPDSLAPSTVQCHTTEQTASVCMNVKCKPSIVLFLFLNSKSAFLFPSRDFTIDFSFKWADAATESGQSVFNSSMKLHTVWILNKLLTYVRLSEHLLDMRRDWHRDAERLTSERDAWSGKGLYFLGGDGIQEKTFTLWVDLIILTCNFQISF